MPYLWPATHAPRYLPAWIAALCFSGCVVVLTWFLRTMLIRHNTKKRAENPSETNFYVY